MFVKIWVRKRRRWCAQLAVATTTPWALQLYGLCVETCPSVDNPEDCFTNPASCMIQDYGTVEQYTAAGGSPVGLAQAAGRA